MTESDGYAGSILFVDLSRGSVNRQPVPEELKRQFLGGRGFGVKLASDLVPADADALGPENVIVFATGPLTGTGVPLGGRHQVVSKSPLNETLCSSDSGAFFGHELKVAGFDAVVFSGKSKKPVFLWIHHGSAEIRDASPYWGMTVTETTAGIQSDLADPHVRVACIGPAGEKLSRIACIMSDQFRAAGRGGLGAVMGSKKLKAVAARGSGRIEIAKPAAFKEAVMSARKKIQDGQVTSKGLASYGTEVLMNLINNNYILPTNNHQTAHFAGAENISGEALTKSLLVRRKPCYGCFIACGRGTKVDGIENEGPEYENAWALGADCGVDDLLWVTRANFACNELGLDAISAGVTVACAMEMSERGFIREEIAFGDGPRMYDLVKKMGSREGIGNEMAEGSYRFASKYGHPELSMSVKKQELAGYDPRGLQGQGLSYATGVRGGDHINGYMVSPEVLGLPQKLDPFTNEGKAVWTKTFQDLTAAIDAAGICLFTSLAPMGAPDYAALVTAVTGMPVDESELLRIGERIWNVQKLFNVRVGYTKVDDTLPDRLLTEPLKEGDPAGHVWRREPLLDEYYAARGWDAEGIPTPAKLAELRLG
ncbi:MAG: aldehyde ferredoxin oxidoreductase family protein [Methanoregula sp.]|nr:aldehyde ferredoxin oxidoreductase family protein [Methanoregula sp.]